jgi:glycerol kinase
VRATGPFVVAIDEGTTGTSAIVFGSGGEKVARAYQEIPQFFPRPGWVEHDPQAIWEATRRVLGSAMRGARLLAKDVAGIGITNQRETLVAWDAKSGDPLTRAIVWQCRRTAPMCDRLRAQDEEGWIRRKTGLVLDPYFSGSKLRWFVENVPKVQRARRDGRLRFGTIDSWLVHRLTRGGAHLTDASNASRTLLFDIRRGTWDEELLKTFRAQEQELPTVVDSSGEVALAHASILGREVPIAGIAGDQQAALFGQACYAPGETKNTYGTGCFALTNTGARAPKPPHGILATVAWRIDGRLTYALEGSVFVGGAVVQWLRDGLRIIDASQDSEPLATSVEDDGGVVVVPAFTGLGAPHWDAHARGAIFGLTRGSTRAHIARAALQSIALQSGDVLRLLSKAAGRGSRALRVDGGATANRYLMQYQADVLGLPVERARYEETTALGAAYLAGLGTGVWRDLKQLARLWRPGARFTPHRDAAWRSAQWRRWNEAVSRTQGWTTAVT